jgi:hypothetical protein
MTLDECKERVLDLGMKGCPYCPVCGTYIRLGWSLVSGVTEVHTPCPNGCGHYCWIPRRESRWVWQVSFMLGNLYAYRTNRQFYE